ncbi:DUF3098 domain-containing protein [Marinigracilibium pacificum]|uniref:DUF3098 domain-containing protein n=1 Tax=Marinigracilibium pacificum TaxID=2729599 RepID=A0A848IXG5_9BACT|nr:DUF3098 domain-containing protein [Marinigracilibium pacificum]NMM48001.1 DUF3098 domain-containing protein [Marinigracilibium pacificum]
MKNNNSLPFDKTNYIILIVGVLVIALGFYIMTLDTEPYGFGTLGLTIGPLIVLAGFAIEFAAIFFKQKNSSSNDQ